MGVEVLIPDFNGEDEPLRTVMEARPDILNHNVETVERLQKPVRKRARYDRSLHVLEAAKAMADEIGYAVHTKSSLMVGLGETREELSQTFRDLRAVDCDILTIGQYLRPSPQHLELVRYFHPDEFAEMKAEALALGFKHVESGPLVRCSYHARDQVPGAELKAQRRQATVTSSAESSRSPARETRSGLRPPGRQAPRRQPIPPADCDPAADHRSGSPPPAPAEPGLPPPPAPAGLSSWPSPWRPASRPPRSVCSPCSGRGCRTARPGSPRPSGAAFGRAARTPR